MTDPRRWLEVEDGVSSLEQRVLEAAARISAPPGARERVWAELAPQIGVAAGVAAGAVTSSAAAATKTTLLVGALKAGAIGAVVGATAIGGALWIAPSPGAPSRSSPNAPPSAATAPQSRQPRSQAGPPPRSVTTASKPETLKSRMPNAARSQEPTAPSPAASPPLDPPSAGPGSRAAYPDAPPEFPVSRAAPEASSPADRTRLESQRLAEARGLLRTGDPAAALAALNQLAREFPNGILAQEREALIVRALVAAGDRDEADARARAFLQRYPNSPHSADVRRALE